MMKILRHLSMASTTRGTYIGNTTQNQCIACCGEEITDAILNRINNAKYYAVIIYETTDIYHTAQLYLNFIYLHKTKIREDFDKFIDVYATACTDHDINYEIPIIEELFVRTAVNVFQELFSLYLTFAG